MPRYLTILIQRDFKIISSPVVVRPSVLEARPKARQPQHQPQPEATTNHYNHGYVPALNAGNPQTGMPAFTFPVSAMANFSSAHPVQNASGDFFRRPADNS
jgi:hypothetical protein